MNFLLSKVGGFNSRTLTSTPSHFYLQKFTAEISETAENNRELSKITQTIIVVAITVHRDLEPLFL